MELTEEEKKIFKIHDEDLQEPASYHIEDGMINSYNSNGEIEQITYGYVKRILCAVAKKRGLDIEENETLNIDELLNEIVVKPENMEDFNPRYLKNEEELQEYVDRKTKDMTLEEMQDFKYDFEELTDCFREYMAENINGIIHKSDKLEAESQESEWDLDSEEEWKNIDFDNFDNDEETIISEDETEWDLDSEEEWENSDFDNDEERIITDEEICKYIKYINSFPQIYECKMNGLNVYNKLYEMIDQRKLKEFHSNRPFMEDFERIMNHNRKKNIYHFHGTEDLESAKLIVKEGLGMMREKLSTTSYTEFTIDEVILYHRGFGEAIGEHAVVIIDQPISEEGKAIDIVDELPKNKKIHFCPSGLQGFEKAQYIVDPKYIVGYIDKLNKRVIFNERYYGYNRFGIQNTNLNRETHKTNIQKRLTGQDLGKAGLDTSNEMSNKADTSVRESQLNTEQTKDEK